MQLLAGVTPPQLLAPGQQPLVRLEIEVATGPSVWLDISNLGGINYLKDVSVTSGGAKVTPNPIAGEFSAVIYNPGNIFHPNHPTSGCQGYFRAGRHVRISLGGTYAGAPTYWPRLIGYMDEPVFSSDTHELTITGLDYIKVLTDTTFTKEFSTDPFTPIDNYWGSLHATPSLPTSILGPELYSPALPLGDAGATFASGRELGNTAANWVGGPNPAVINPFGPAPFTAWEIKIDADPVKNHSSSHYNNVCNVVAGTQYTVSFTYARTVGTTGGAKWLRFTLYSVATAAIVGGISHLDPPINYPASGAYETCTFTFTPTAADAGMLDLHVVLRNNGTAASPVPMTWRVDEISIKAAPPPATEVYYPMPAGCTGIYHVELDGVAQWPGKQKGEGWYYDAGTNRFWFDIDKVVAAGVGNNLDIYYFTTQAPHTVVADILVKAGLYATRAAVFVDMGAGTGWDTFTIDRVWFEAGSNYLEAVKMLCERTNRRFYFDANGMPQFVTAPVIGGPVFPLLGSQHIRTPLLYQNKAEIRNRIVIQGEKVAELVGWQENMPSELKDEQSNPGSITTYGERTLPINNYLFQDLASITTMCTTLLAAYAIPKWYFDFETPYNAVPLELGDTIPAQERLAAAIFVIHTCLIRDMSISRYNVTYVCET